RDRPPARHHTINPSTHVLLYPQPGDHRELHSFPTRRSSDLEPENTNDGPYGSVELPDKEAYVLPLLKKSFIWARSVDPAQPLTSDRKSTRLNSSHVKISYAVFCLKKKKETVSAQSIRLDKRV